MPNLRRYAHFCEKRKWKSSLHDWFVHIFLKGDLDYLKNIYPLHIYLPFIMCIILAKWVGVNIFKKIELPHPIKGSLQKRHN